MKKTSSKDNSKNLVSAAGHSIVVQNKNGDKVIQDNRPEAEIQMKMVETLQKSVEDEEELLQGKFTAQRQGPDEEELLQG